jgi:hypothetical protein
MSAFHNVFWRPPNNDSSYSTKKDDYKLARAVEEGLITPPPSEADCEKGSANIAYIPCQVVDRAGTSKEKNLRQLSTRIHSRN